MKNYFLISTMLHMVAFGAMFIGFPTGLQNTEHTQTIPVEFIELSKIGQKTNIVVPDDEKKIEDIPLEQATRGVNDGAIKINKNEKLTKTSKTEEAVKEKKSEKVKPIKNLPKIPRKPKRLNNKNANKKNKIDKRKLAALIDRISKESALGREKSRVNVDEIKKIVLSDTGKQKIAAALSHVQIDLLKTQISRCWNPPIGLKGARNQVVVLNIALNSDGSLAKRPVNMQSIENDIIEVFIESAIRAVIQCAPYSMPQKNYAAWKELRLNFDPKGLLN